MPLFVRTLSFSRFSINIVLCIAYMRVVVTMPCSHPPTSSSPNYHCVMSPSWLQICPNHPSFAPSPPIFPLAPSFTSLLGKPCCLLLILARLMNFSIQAFNPWASLVWSRRTNSNPHSLYDLYFTNSTFNTSTSLSTTSGGVGTFDVISTSLGEDRGPTIRWCGFFITW